MAPEKTISLDDFREKKRAEKEGEPFFGTLVWLFCPVCDNIEYTEIIAPAGRKHKCGTQVKEIEVELDLRSEMTVCLYNIQLICELIKENSKFKLLKLHAKSLDKVLKSLKNSEECYLERIILCAGRAVLPYPGELEELLDRLHIITRNQLGLLISDFRYEPEKRFKKDENKK